jgi:hypothetical protein
MFQPWHIWAGHRLVFSFWLHSRQYRSNIVKGESLGADLAAGHLWGRCFYLCFSLDQHSIDRPWSDLTCRVVDSPRCPVVDKGVPEAIELYINKGRREFSPAFSCYYRWFAVHAGCSDMLLVIVFS